METIGVGTNSPPFSVSFKVPITTLHAFSSLNNDVPLRKNDIGHTFGVHAPCEISEITPAYEARKRWDTGLTSEQLEGIERVNMDRWPACINTTLERVRQTQRKVALDTFRVVNGLGTAVDKVRRQEHRAWMKEACTTSREKGLVDQPENMSRTQKARFQTLRTSTLKATCVWVIQKMAMKHGHDVYRTWADQGLERWLSRAMQCRLEPGKSAARTINTHRWRML